jgi:hypothetical protein
MEGVTSPWSVVADLDHVDVYLTVLDPSCGGGLTVQRADGRVAIFLERRGDARGRRAALAHELVHLRRGLLPRDAPGHLVDREEAAVRAETAAWLVPREMLLGWAARAAEVEPIRALEVAERFDVPVSVAWEALRRVA